MTYPTIRERLAEFIDLDTVERVLQVVDEERTLRCRDVNCVRRRRHPRLSRHLWRHTATPSGTPGLLGWRCFTCGRYTWSRLHRAGRRR